MVQIRLIGLTGYARTGKSTAADLLIKKHNFTRVRMADPLKIMLSSLLEHIGTGEQRIHDMLHGDKKAEPFAPFGGKSARDAMQTLGTEWGRNAMGHDFWVNIARPYIEWLLKQGHDVVVDDIRFQNEVDMIRDLGGHVFAIKRSGVGPANDHPSEQLDFTNLSGHIWNDGGFDELYLRLVAQMFKVQRHNAFTSLSAEHGTPLEQPLEHSSSHVGEGVGSAAP